MNADLPNGVTWLVEGRLVDASNLVVRMVAEAEPGTNPADAAGDDQATSDDTNLSDAPRAVFKPTLGERPLSDFPPATLAHREVATYVVAQAAGLTCVPETRWFDHEIGSGSLQRWVGPLQPQEQTQVELLDEEEFDPQRHLPIAAFDSEDGPLLLTHTREQALRDVALLDVLTNNADRKGSHLIESTDGLFAIDHGLTFHVEDKLRTVLWGFAGEPLTAREGAAISRLCDHRAAVDEQLANHLSPEEIAAFWTRLERLRTAGHLPEPPEDRYGLPWPPL